MQLLQLLQHWELLLLCSTDPSSLCGFPKELQTTVGFTYSDDCWGLHPNRCSPQSQTALQITDGVSSYYQHRLTKSANKGPKPHSWNSCYGIWSFISFVLNTANFSFPLRFCFSCLQPVPSSHTFDHCSDHCLVPLYLEYPCFRKTHWVEEGLWNWIPFLIVSISFFCSPSLENLLTLHTVKPSVQSLVALREGSVSPYKEVRN